MLELTFVLTTVGVFGLIYAIHLLVEFKRYESAIGNLPGYRVLLSPTSLFANMIPVPIPGITLGGGWAFRRKREDFDMVGKDVFGTVSLWPRAHGTICFADAATLKDITLSRARFPKPVKQYRLVLQFGRNIVATEGSEWRKHRKIANPAFSESNYKLVWDEAVRVTLEIIDNVWMNREEVVGDHANDVTTALALLIIGSAGFGRKISFEDDHRIPPGHKLSFKEALQSVSSNPAIPIVFPRWSAYFSKKLSRAFLAFEELQRYMQEMIDARRASERKGERFDLFSLLLDANMEENDDEDSKLLDSELIGNIFIFLLAGHETTAHTLAFTLGLLALHQDEQEKLFQHITSVLPKDRLPGYDDMNSFTYVLAVFYETLRLFPPVPTIPKISAEDQTVTTTNAQGEKFVVAIPKGCSITLHTPGLHYNPRYWEDPYAFKPSRFLEDWPRDAFLPFSGGVRSCIGRKFSETESIAILVILLSRYRVEVKEEPQYVNETFEQKQERVLSAGPGITLTPKRIPLVFKRR